MTDENPNPDYYATITGYGDSIELWAESHGLTLDEALDEGVCSPERGGDCVFVPFGLIKELEDQA